MLWRVLRAAFSRRSSPTPFIQRALDLRNRGELAAAEQVLRTALGTYPRDATVATNLAAALLEQDKGQEAIALLEQAIEIDPRCAAAQFNYANLLRMAHRHGDAIVHYRAAKEASAEFAHAPEELMHVLLEVCGWDEAESIADELREKVRRSPEEKWMPYVSPLTAVYLGLSRDECKRVAAYRAPKAIGSGGVLTATRVRAPGERIRIGYFSRDFRDHPVGHMLRGVFSLHDRSRFETYAFSFGLDDGSVYRKAIEQGVDRFVDLASHSDGEAARVIAAANIDVLIDLMGHTTGNRMAVLARRPAPVQAHYLGYPGTTGAPYVDYFISDEVVTPAHLAGDFTEKIAYVEDCFMVSDGAAAREALGMTRQEQKLPQDAYVFANFGNPSRITRETFGLWMRILEGAPGSVLWLRRADDLVVANLERAARAAGVDPQRLVFAERVREKSGHFGRLPLADLALDTLGWHNGHSTTADMLWAGVPVLTVPGNTFPSRVAASLARACRLHEVVADDAEDYVTTAIRLANDSDRSRAVRNALHAARASAPFFDTASRVRALEAAYEAMWAAKMQSRGSVAQSVRAEDS